MKIKKIVAAFMAAAIACGSVAVTAGAEEIRSFTAESYGGASVKSDKLTEDGCIYDGCKYILSNNELYFDGEPYRKDDVYSGRKELVIPAKIDEIPVTRILGFDADYNSKPFKTLSMLERIYIPSSIEKIDCYASWEDRYVAFMPCGSLTDVYFEGTEEQWYNIQGNVYIGAPHIGYSDKKWDGKFSKDSNLAYGGIENVTLHVNCKSIDDEGTIVNFSAKAEKPAKVSGIKRSGSKTYIKLSWNESKNAESYVIKYSTDKKTWKTKTVKANSVKLTKLKAGT